VKPILILSIILIGRSIGCFAQHQHDTLRWEFGKNDRIDVKKSVITDPLLDLENQQIHTRLYYYDEHSGTGLTFKGSVICTSNHFSKQVDMRAAKFANNSDFSSDTFRRSAEFTQSVFGDDAAFSSCLFRDTANFNRAEFGQGADFSNTVFGGIGYFRMSPLVRPLPSASHRPICPIPSISQTTPGSRAWSTLWMPGLIPRRCI
jgi:Pentapeptide repeats (9 copies)